MTAPTTPTPPAAAAGQPDPAGPQVTVGVDEVIAELSAVVDRKNALAERENQLKDALRDSGVTDWTTPDGLRMTVTQSRSLTHEVAETLLSPQDFDACFEQKFSPARARKYVSDDVFDTHAVATGKPSVTVR